MSVSRFSLGAAALATIAVGALVGPTAAAAGPGNGAPNGAHYNLNLIGVPKDKTADMDGNNGHRIFVPEYGKANIYLREGDFGVVDANGTDSDGAKFQLPNPDSDGDGTTSYSVYVRALGKPDRSALMQSCYTDPVAGETWCAVDYDPGTDSVDQIEITRSKGGVAKFENVSRDLLYVDACTAYDTTTGECTTWDQVPLFSDVNGKNGADEIYFWEYDNKGLKNAQLRFYEVPTQTPWVD